MSAVHILSNPLSVAASSRVLVVDDDPAIREMLTDVLADEGLSVLAAETGAAALSLLDGAFPELILLDARMPVLDGFATCAHIRSDPNGVDVPILMITAQCDDIAIAQAFDAGANDVLCKPLNLTLLIARVQHLIHQYQQASSLRVSEERFRALFRHSPDGIVLLEPVGNDWLILDANPQFCALCGARDEHLLGRQYSDLLAPESMQLEHFCLDRTHAKGVSQGQITLQQSDGYTVSVEYRASSVTLNQRERVLVIHRDITERLTTEQALRESEARFSSMFYASPVAITITARTTQRIVNANDSFLALVGYTRDEVIGRTSADLGLWIEPSSRETVLDALQRHDRIYNIELELRVNGGQIRSILFSLEQIDLDGETCILAYGQDITARKQAEEQLLHHAFHDALTGLPNRALFLDRLGKTLDRAARVSERFSAVLFLDLDRFKTINDSLGHLAGDQLLIAAARRLERCVRQGDTVARLGGDEFAILLEDMLTPQAAIDVAERIKVVFQAPVLIAGQEIVSNASIGIALGTSGHTQPEALLRDADIAMYTAKRSGLGCYAIADPTMHAHLRARLELEAELRHALDREEFVLHYQPKMAMDGQVILGVEVLIRWQHPVRGFIAPGEFIPLAEETGLIGAIGEWVLRTACVQMRQWRDEGLPPLFIAVNLSAQQLKQHETAATVRTILIETGLAPQYLCLELTESVLMEDAESTIAALHQLRAIGIRALAIDDFGTGYSSLSYLQRFPVTEIKIDRSFVCEITTNPSNAAIAVAIIALAHSLGLHAIAEGVETEQQRLFLERAGCDRFQGYLVSRPLPPEQCTTFFQRMSATRNADR